MPHSQQKLNKLVIRKLKNLTDLEIDFNGQYLTGILGPNCSGKTTILHALSCIYKPMSQEQSNYKFSQFFPPTNHTSWTDSNFLIYHDYRDGKDEHKDCRVEYKKQADRWSPKYDRRPERYVSYIGVRSAVPAIETETQKARINFSTQPLNDEQSQKAKDIVGCIFNRNYTAYNKHITPKNNKTYFGVRYSNIDYSSLSMGAGEQRAFYIIGEVLKAPKYALILIDEIDLLMHQTALVNLLNQLNKIATDKILQIVFTTHNQTILSLDNINFRHILHTPAKTICFNNTKPEAIYRLTGAQQKPIELFVEDLLSKCLVRKIAAELGILKYVSVNLFGAATNCFTAVSGALLNDLKNLENMLFILDGDIYNTATERESRVKQVLSGDDERAVGLRRVALTKICQFVLPAGIKPEKHYHSCIVGMDDSTLSEELKEIYLTAKQIERVDDAHKYLYDIITRLGYEINEIGYSKIIDVLSKTEEWNSIILDIKNWLTSKKDEITECN